MDIKDAAKGLVGALVEHEKPETFYRLYHDLVEALLHPYNRDALDQVRRSVGIARYQRERGRLTTDAETLQLILDSEAVLASLGVEPIPHTDEDSEKFKRVMDTVLGHAEKTLREVLPSEVFDEQAPAGPVH